MKISDLQQKFPQNDIIIDNFGKASVMVRIKKFYLDEVIDGASHIPHPAFIVDGRELDAIYISKFQNVVIDGLAYALPDCDPATRIDFDTASRACRAKGEGFHLMSATEWSAIALWCQKYGWLPYGNNGDGKDIRESDYIAKLSFCDKERSIFRTATGSGPIEWSHNRQADGIYDLNANVWEWIGGIRLVRGELQILPSNNAASQKYSLEESSGDWRAINGKNGNMILPDGHGSTPDSVKLDFINGRWTFITDQITSSLDDFRFCNFADVTTDGSVCDKAKELLYSLTCLPTSSFTDGNVAFYANNGADERIPFRGGRWGQGLNSGIFKSCFDDPRSYSGDAVGFRSAYYKT